MASFNTITPIFRIFDETKAREFYLSFLEFRLDFEHRFEPNAPIYMGISRDECVLHLSEHHGDLSPGAHIRIRTDDVDGLSQGLSKKKYKYANPGAPENTPWDTKEITLTDPFGNRLTFVQE